MNNQIEEDIEYLRKKLYNTKSSVLQERYEKQIKMLKEVKEVQNKERKNHE